MSQREFGPIALVPSLRLAHLPSLLLLPQAQLVLLELLRQQVLPLRVASILILVEQSEEVILLRHEIILLGSVSSDLLERRPPAGIQYVQE